MTLRPMLGVPALVLAISSPVLAQTTTPAPAPAGIYIAALGGALVQPRAAGAFGVEYGDQLGRRVVAYAALSYFEDLMDGSITDQLAVLSRQLTARTARTWDLHGRDRGVAFVTGAKYHFGVGTIKPYLGGGAGALAVRRRIADRLVGDVTAATLSEFSIGDASLTTNTVTRPLVEGALGVDFDFGRTHAEVGYRYHRAFHLSQTPDFSQAVIGVGINF